MKERTKMKVEWAWINAHKNAITLTREQRERRERDFSFCFKNVKRNTSNVPDHDDVLESRDVKWLSYDSMKVAVASLDAGLPAHLFKALEYIQFVDEEGGSGDLMDYLEADAQRISLGFKVHDDRGRYEVNMTVKVLETAQKNGQQILPHYLLIEQWGTKAGANCA